MSSQAPALTPKSPPLDRLKVLGRGAARRKPEAGPAALTARHRLLVEYMVFGCESLSVCERFMVDRSITTEDGPATITRQLKVGEAMSLIEAADMLRIRRRNARDLWELPIFRDAYEKALRAYREGEKGAALRTLVEIRDDPGLGKAADRKVRLQASQVLLGEAGGNTSVNVAVGVGMGVLPGYILDLEERDDEEPTIIEHRSA